MHRTASLSSLPKVDLRRRLEGSLSVAALAELVREQGSDLPAEPVEFRRILTERPLLSQRRELLQELYRSESVLRRAARQAVEAAAQENIRYLELRFAPIALSQRGDNSMEEVVAWVLDTVAQACTDREMRVGLLLSFDRGNPISAVEQLTRLAVDRHDDGVAGLCLEGDTEDVPLAAIREILGQAQESGLGITVDVAHPRGAEGVLEAVGQLHAARIGNGHRVLENPRALRAAIEGQVGIEICLSMDSQSGATGSPNSHPLEEMIQAGLHLTLNTEVPGLIGMDLTDEYRFALEQRGISMETLKGLILTGAQSAFLPQKARRELERSLVWELFGG